MCVHSMAPVEEKQCEDLVSQSTERFYSSSSSSLSSSIRVLKRHLPDAYQPLIFILHDGTTNPDRLCIFKMNGKGRRYLYSER